MRYRFSQRITGIPNFKSKALSWANNNFQTICYLDNNGYGNYQYRTYEGLIGIGALDSISCNAGNAFEKLSSFYGQKSDWLFGFLGYDLKNEIEDLNSGHRDGIELPDLFFFQPEHIIELKENQVTIHASDNDPEELFRQILNAEDFTSQPAGPIDLQSRLSQSSYIETIESIREHIAKGDIYELNFCMEFYAEQIHANPLEIFSLLNKLSKAPFSSYLKSDGKYLMCASPERFIKKTGSKLISQPIKGTMHRGKGLSEDEVLKTLLASDPKEKAENMMIVDLVRNDLSRSCVPGSVLVEKLFEVKTFEQVHQLVSTIIGQLREDVHFIDAIKNAFPMGSMTGAPKIKAMQLIEQYERTKRGLYSGAVGYITPESDFDFNVVIRSMLYSQSAKYLSYQVGSAITYNSVPEKEYEECLLKANGMNETLNRLKRYSKASAAIPL